MYVLKFFKNKALESIFEQIKQILHTVRYYGALRVT